VPGQSQTAVRDGSTWPVGTEDEVAWINAGVTRGMSITASIPPVFAAYATLAFPLDLDAPHERLRGVGGSDDLISALLTEPGLSPEKTDPSVPDMWPSIMPDEMHHRLGR
jgi:hypothetical protein